MIVILVHKKGIKLSLLGNATQSRILGREKHETNDMTPFRLYIPHYRLPFQHFHQKNTDVKSCTHRVKNPTMSQTVGKSALLNFVRRPACSTYMFPINKQIRHSITEADSFNLA